MRDSHPTELELELWHVGEGEKSVNVHLQGCAVCRGKVALFEQQKSRFADPTAAKQFVETLRGQVLENTGVYDAPPVLDTDQLSCLVSEEETTAPSKQPLRFLLAALVLGGMGGLFLVARSFDQGAPQAATSPEALSLPTAKLILMRAQQELLAERAAVAQVGDTLSVEFSLKTPGSVEAGVLSQTKVWTQLFKRQFDAGTHKPGEMLTVSADHEGQLLLGAPNAVAAARAGELTAPVARIDLAVE